MNEAPMNEALMNEALINADGKKRNLDE